MDFFKNGSGWCQRITVKGKRIEGPPVRSHAPIFRKKEAISDKRQAEEDPSSKRQAPSLASSK
jgi:hypothetical protein